MYRKRPYIGPFYGHDHERMEMVPFLQAYMEHPKLEHLVKTGFYALVSDLTYRGSDCPQLDEVQNRTHRILRVAAEDVDFLRELDVDSSTLAVFQEYSGMNLKDRQKLLSWQLESHVSRDLPPVLEHVTAHRLMWYLDGQYAFLQYRQTRYHILMFLSSTCWARMIPLQ